jgi:type VI secretion system protein ImpC
MSQARPMAIAVLGDFGGRRESGRRRLRRVDRETLDDVMAGLGVEVEVPDDDGAAVLRLAALSDLHPDAFTRRVPGLTALLEGGEQPAEPVRTVQAPAPVPSGKSILDTILGGPPAPSPARDAIQDLARRVAEPSTVRSPAPRSGDHDRRLADGVRAVLAAPRFRVLESAWRGLTALVQEAETGESLQVYMLDGARDDAPLLLAEELATPGAPRPTCVLATYTFGPGDVDLAVLEQLGAVALAAGTPLVADAAPSMVGVDEARDLGDPDVRRRIGMGSGPAAWRVFRSSPAAANLTLVLPRLLLRAPYGSSGEEVTTFRFAEQLTGRDHERFLWGSAALAYGRVLARAFASEGWDADLERYATLDGLPVHVWREGGEECVLPCAEAVMSEATVGRLLEERLMVAASVRGTDRVAFRRTHGLTVASG